MSIVGYESTKNAGFDILTNADLRTEVVYLFEDEYLTMQNARETLGETFNEIVKIKHERFLRKPKYRYAPFIFNHLKSDLEFQSWHNYLYDTRKWVILFLENTLGETQRVLQLIKKELDKG